MVCVYSGTSVMERRTDSPTGLGTVTRACVSVTLVSATKLSDFHENCSQKRLIKLRTSATFRKNRLSNNHVSPRDVIHASRSFPYFVTDLGEIRYWLPRNSVHQL